MSPSKDYFEKELTNRESLLGFIFEININDFIASLVYHGLKLNDERPQRKLLEAWFKECIEVFTNEDNITRDVFGKMNQIIPFPFADGNWDNFKKIFEFLQQDGFFGFMSRDECEKTFAENASGRYRLILRYSLKQGEFVLSYNNIDNQNHSKIIHYIITLVDGGFYIGGKTFPTLHEHLEALSIHYRVDLSSPWGSEYRQILQRKRDEYEMFDDSRKSSPKPVERRIESITKSALKR